jgi:uncharacterized membrane protein YbhN (UPF0104 family)
MGKRVSSWLLKLIGVALFIIILSKIDRESLFEQIKTANLSLLAISFPMIFLIYFCKAKRFEQLVHTTEVILHFSQNWKIFNIGIFLASITPGKIGEFGRAAYLKAHGVSMGIAIAITIVDRLIDVIFISIISVAGVGILFGWKWTIVGIFVVGAGVSAVMLLRNAFAMLRQHITKKMIVPISLWTIAAWSIYFSWAILLGHAIGIEVSIPVMIAVLIFAGILSLLPIAPSGLGTRDATLVFLLAPYGIEAEQAVALALLMFISIIFSSFLGGWYWVKGVR